VTAITPWREMGETAAAQSCNVCHVHSMFVRPAQRLVVHRHTGQVARAELIAAFTAQFRHPDFTPGFASLADFRDVQLELHPDDLQPLAAAIDEAYAGRPSGRSAVLVARPLETALSVLFMRSTTRDIAVFSTLAAACAWLAVEPPPELRA
jgi:hypothetical protein